MWAFPCMKSAFFIPLSRTLLFKLKKTQEPDCLCVAIVLSSNKYSGDLNCKTYPSVSDYVAGFERQWSRDFWGLSQVRLGPTSEVGTLRLTLTGRTLSLWVFTTGLPFSEYPWGPSYSPCILNRYSSTGTILHRHLPVEKAMQFARNFFQNSR